VRLFGALHTSGALDGDDPRLDVDLDCSEGKS
jgi:hypothetical protein